MQIVTMQCINIIAFVIVAFVEIWQGCADQLSCCFVSLYNYYFMTVMKTVTMHYIIIVVTVIVVFVILRWLRWLIVVLICFARPPLVRNFKSIVSPSLLRCEYE